MQKGVGSPAQDLASEPNLNAVGRRFYWCCALVIVINIVVFAAMNAQMPLEGDNSFSAKHAVDWGASYGPSTFSGQPWRLIASAFIHYNFSHIGYNMAVLALLGSEVEKRFGSFKFFVIYLFAAVAGSCLSLLLSPVGAGAGASGACYGMGGAMLAYLMLQKNGFKPFPLSWFGVIGLVYLAQSFYFATVGGAGSANHIGGLIAGFFTGYTFYNAPSGAPRSHQTLGIAFIVASMVALFISVTYVPLDFRSNYKLAKAVHEFEEGNLAMARNQLLEYVKSQPQSPIGYFQLAGLAHLEKREHDAKRLYEQAEALNFDGPALLPDLADTCYEIGLNQEAVDCAYRGYKKSGELEILAKASDAYAELGQWDKAFEIARQLKEKRSTRRLGIICQSELLLWQGKTDQAIASLKELTDRAKVDVRANYLLATIYAVQGRYIESRQLVETLRSKVSKSKPYPFECTIYLALDDFRAASFSAENILKDKDNLADGSAAYGGIYKWFALYRDKDLVGQKQLSKRLEAQLRIKCWPYPLYQYLSGALSYEEVLKAADTAGKMTELETFVGLKDYVDGDNSSAYKQLKLVKDKGLKAYMEHDLASIIIARMERKVIDLHQ
ncbi:MAG: rhomboid family intramembrane serine protease [Candidatus Obscuribacter sp.]|nr:rhomboid family intramembrane serine protease [Candidatus Obscuribacter sp.]